MATRTLDGWTRRRMGWGVAGLAAGLLGTVSGEVGTARKKRKRCPKPPRCPESCPYIFSTPDGGEICGIGNSIFRNPQCQTCSTSRECNNSTFPHCLNSFTNLLNNQTGDFQNFCGPYTLWVCGIVTACIT